MSNIAPSDFGSDSDGYRSPLQSFLHVSASEPDEEPGSLEQSTPLQLPQRQTRLRKKTRLMLWTPVKEEVSKPEKEVGKIVEKAADEEVGKPEEEVGKPEEEVGKPEEESADTVATKDLVAPNAEAVQKNLVAPDTDAIFPVLKDLGCPKCRWSRSGCLQCKQADYKPRGECCSGGGREEVMSLIVMSLGMVAMLMVLRT